jgi:preprotein translocase subunit SecE
MAAEVAQKPQPNIIARVVLFYHEVMQEMRRVTWPDAAQLRQATIGILVVVLFVGALIAVMDVVLQQVLVRGIPSLFGGR